MYMCMYVRVYVCTCVCMYVCMCVYVYRRILESARCCQGLALISFSLSLSLSHTHTHTHSHTLSHRERERERETRTHTPLTRTHRRAHARACLCLQPAMRMSLSAARDAHVPVCSPRCGGYSLQWHLQGHSRQGGSTPPTRLSHTPGPLASSSHPNPHRTVSAQMCRVHCCHRHAPSRRQRGA